MKNNYKMWIILSLITVFIAGVLCGVLFKEHILERERRGSRGKRSSVHFPTLEIMAQELNLTSEQQNNIKEFFSSNEERFRALRNDVHKSLSSIRTQMIADIKSVLDEDQNSKFEAMIEKYKAQRRREIEERKKQAERSHGDKGNKD
jgi:hypothetical protein